MKVTLKDSLQSLVVTGKFKGMSVHGSLLADECMCSFYAARQERVQGTEGALALVQLCHTCSTPVHFLTRKISSEYLHAVTKTHQSQSAKSHFGSGTFLC